jgi:hypothetical protein
LRAFAQLLERCVDAFLATTGDDDDVRALFRIAFRGGEADAAGSPCDDGGLPGKTDGAGELCGGVHDTYSYF